LVVIDIATPTGRGSSTGDSPPRKKLATASRAVQKKPAAALVSQRRGAAVEVKTKGQYGAGKSYTLTDVAKLCREVEDGEHKLEWFDPTHPKHNPQVHIVPKSTMKRWLMDDEKVMARKGKRGTPGVPHWRAETEVRRSTQLKTAGGYKGTGKSVLGAAESALMVKMVDNARQGKPYAEDDIKQILLDTCIDLKVTNTRTGMLYTKDTDVFLRPRGPAWAAHVFHSASSCAARC